MSKIKQQFLKSYGPKLVGNQWIEVQRDRMVGCPDSFSIYLSAGPVNEDGIKLDYVYDLSLRQRVLVARERCVPCSVFEVPSDDWLDLRVKTKEVSSGSVFYAYEGSLRYHQEEMWWPLLVCDITSPQFRPVCYLCSRDECEIVFDQGRDGI